MRVTPAPGIISRVEPEYMNIHRPPPPINALAPVRKMLTDISACNNLLHDVNISACCNLRVFSCVYAAIGYCQ